MTDRERKLWACAFLVMLAVSYAGGAWAAFAQPF